MAGDFAYIANTGSNNLTGIAVTPGTGEVMLFDDGGATADTGAGPIDLAISPDHGFLYSLANTPVAEVAATASKEIHVFGIQPDGSLNAMGTLPGLPASAAGLVAR